MARRPLVAALLGAVLLLAACSPDHKPPAERAAPWPDDPDLLIDFTQPTGGAVPGIVATPADTEVETVAVGGARLSQRPGPGPGSTAAVFPSEDEAVDGGLLALTITPPDDDEAFAPGGRDFVFGVDVLLPVPSSRSEEDNGDNLVQRGLFGDTGQVKLQVDDGVPSCRVAGDQGVATVKAASGGLATETWFRLRCQREGDRLTLYVGRLDDEGDVASWEHWSAVHSTGTVSFPDPATPISVGAKLNPRGGLVVRAPDQFNGALAHVVFTLRDHADD
ncbi:MAG: hypothetical protein QM714_17110 [Nocardioides sp.]|uniref:hypothetical protein n=1 Tax=Nocardioides sp. TaxID=35761 RepID=UPI0039E51B22